MENNATFFQQLQSADTEEIKETLRIAQKEADATYIPGFLDLLVTHDNPYLTTPLAELLADIKDPGFKTLLVDKLQATDSEKGQIRLLRVVWESALDFSEELDLFVHHLLHSPFLVAIEALTAIENLSGITPEAREKAIFTLEKATPGAERDFLVADALTALYGNIKE